MRDDEWERIVVFRTHVNEMNVESIDLGDDLLQGVQLRLDLPPVVLGRPVARECLNRGELHALRLVRDCLAIRPPCHLDAPAQLGEFLLGNIHTKRTNRGLLRRLLGTLLHSRRWGHCVLLETTGTARLQLALRGRGLFRLSRPLRIHTCAASCRRDPTTLCHPVTRNSDVILTRRMKDAYNL